MCVCVCGEGGGTCDNGRGGYGPIYVGRGVSVVCGEPSICVMIPEERELVLGTPSAVPCTCTHTHKTSYM